MRRCFGSSCAIQLSKRPASAQVRKHLSTPACISRSRHLAANRSQSLLPAFHCNIGVRFTATVCGASKPANAPSENGTSPYELVQTEIDNIYRTIPKELSVDLPALTDLAEYYFLGSRGKAFRPMVILLVASLCNKMVLPFGYAFSTSSEEMNALQVKSQAVLLKDASAKQQRLAMICEMIHTASLIHDDVIDASDVRRGQPTLHKVAGEKKVGGRHVCLLTSRRRTIVYPAEHAIRCRPYKQAILTGDYILAVCCKVLASLRNPDVIVCVAQVVEDLVKGELVQMSQSFAAPNKRFDQYLRKTYLKTASLIANSCKAVAIFSQEAATLHTDNDAKLPGASEQQLSELCYSFGRNVGMAFQIVDDLLDYAATEEHLGKPAAGADLRLGIATAPVLYAADSLPNSSIHERITRRFTGPDDYRLTFAEVMQSNVLEKTRELAKSYVERAQNDLKAIAALAEAKSGDRGFYVDIETERRALQQVCDMTLTRDR